MKKIEISRSDNPEVQNPRQYQPIDGVGRNYIFGYSKCIRNTNKAMVDLFSDITVLNEDDGSINPIPIVWGDKEKAAAVVFGEQFANNPDRIQTGLIDRIILPILAIKGGDIAFAQNRYIFHEARRKVAYGKEKEDYDVVYRFSKGIPVDMNYTLYVWTMYYEHLMQIVEQILQKFSPISYINVENLPWETIVKLTGSSNNVAEDVADRDKRILKYTFTLTAESHITQPVRRDKTALKITQKYVVLGDLMPSGEIETFTEEAKAGEVPQDTI